MGAAGGVHAPILPRGVAHPLLHSNPYHLLSWASQVVYPAALHSRTVALNAGEAVAAFLDHMGEDGEHHTALGQVPKASVVCVLVRLMDTPDWVVGIRVAEVGVVCASLDHQGM